jgi:hypothetical protein
MAIQNTKSADLPWQEDDSIAVRKRGRSGHRLIFENFNIDP